MNNKKSEQNVNYGQKLKKAREALGLTQEKVAEYLGLGPRYISDIERNKTKGSIDTLLKLCNAYKITPDIILYDLLDEDLKNNVSIYEEKFKKLSQRDKESILHFIEYFLSNHN